ncbi:AMP-binding protein [Spirosoma montaniterrae]|uniref:O-succinylbenzoic acid--CoA ligase n=1 Tax=Spirosoma montaniterrae TaxID=1178516 RepID=A0A1P9WUV2_9BACT|nr:AMP-binding protein [Spirosoma montaniterrae]AQG79123.1 O-succinylbenzoic acid--CoA ligase [Spirosoma montaniterrae]
MLLSASLLPEPATSYEAEATAFCRAWLGGQDTFTLHTSGSTGSPKPIVLTRAQMRASAHLTGQTLGLQPGDAALVCLNVRYVAGVMMLVRGLELGLPMTLIEPTGNPLAGFSVDTTFAFTALVPLQLQAILENTPDKLPILNRMKAILVGGAATSPALEQALQAIDAPVYATYGMTETVSHIALRRLNGPDRSDLFTALEGVSLGTDERGCLHITSAVTNFERVQTNDVVERLDEKRFRLLGRADMVINSGGVKVQPEPVERVVQEVLARFGLMPRLFVAGLPDERLGQQVTVIIEQMSINGTQWAAIQNAVRVRLGPYAVPKDWQIVPTFAETPTGKIDHRATIDLLFSKDFRKQAN